MTRAQCTYECGLPGVAWAHMGDWQEGADLI